MNLLRRLWTWLFAREVPCEHERCDDPVAFHDTALDIRYCRKHAERQEVPHG